MSFDGFRAFSFDANMGGDGWNASAPYASKITFQIRELIDSAHDFTYRGVFIGDDVRRPTHDEVLQYAGVVDAIIERYRSMMLEQETAAGVDAQNTQYGRQKLPTTSWLTEVLFHNRDSAMLQERRYEMMSSGAIQAETGEESRACNVEFEVNLYGTAALMDIDEGLVSLCDSHARSGDGVLGAIDLFLGAADGIRIAAGIEVHTAFEIEYYASLGSGRARALAYKRHEPTKKLRDRARELYKAGTWPSKLQAAKHITPQLKAFAREIGASALRGERAQQTVYEWIRAIQD